MNKYIQLDLETTGLDDFDTDQQITEMAWISDLGPRHFYVQHSRLPSDWVLKNTDYVSRILPADKAPLRHALSMLIHDCRRLTLKVGDVSEKPKVFLMGANPSFDDRFIRRALRENFILDMPYDYHLIDIEAVVMGHLKLPNPPRLKDCRRLLGIPGLFGGRHTAEADAQEVKLIWDWISP